MAPSSIVNIYEAKTRFSELIKSVESGDEYVVARAGRPVARIVPYVSETGPRPGRGSARGRIWVSEDFDAPLADIEEDFLAGTTIP
jgi:prevent-host-death family protein